MVEAVRPRLLAVLAHPDDETFGTGGTLALYSWCGAAVHLICTTDGAAGVMSPELLQRHGTVAAVRTAELRCAAEKLGLTGVHMMGYRDSGMPGSPDNQHPESLFSAPLDEVTAQITQAIRVIRPHVVITFDPIGGYRHPDHIITHQATVKAFHAAGDPKQYPDDRLPPYTPQKLYYSVFPRLFLRLTVRVMPLLGKDPTRFGRNQDVDLTSFAFEDFPVHAKIDFLPVEKQREQAVACHASQVVSPTLTQSVIGWITRLLSGGESFMRAYPAPEPGLRERDLFQGVHID
jgi:LmbE family N-acetylglucosaminyl deacetylase